MPGGRFQSFSRCAFVAALGLAIQPGSAAAIEKIPVAIFGDSIGYEAEPFFAARLEGDGRFAVKDRTRAATAPCDWMWGLKTFPLAPQPAAVVVETLGVSVSDCQADAKGKRPPRDSAAYFASYRLQLQQFIDMFPKKTKFFLSSAPPTSSGAGYRSGAKHKRMIVQMLAEVAATRPNSTVFDAAARLQNPSGLYVRAVACVDALPCTDSPAPGKAVVRALDGIHFCPSYGPSGTSLYLRRCPVPDVGAMIFGNALAEPVLAAFPA